MPSSSGLLLVPACAADEGFRGHVSCSFLALLLMKELEQRLQEAGIRAERQDVIRDLQRLREAVLEAQGKRFVVRTRAVGHVADIMRCVGARVPPTVRLEQDREVGKRD